MQFTSMSPGIFAGLALATVTVLAVLQFLRPRAQPTRVVTSLFWKESTKHLRARRLFGSFRNPWTYLLLAIACLLVLLAIAAPILGAKEDARRVVILEAGLMMTAEDGRFENARKLVWAEARGVAEERVAVMVADPHPRIIKHFDEDLVVLQERLAAVTPKVEPVSREGVLSLAQSLLPEAGDHDVVLISAQPAEVDFERVRVLAAGDRMNNAFILSTVFSSTPGNQREGSFHCRIGFTGDKTGALSVKITRKGETLMKEDFEIMAGGTQVLRVSDLVADGSTLDVEVTGSDLVGGDSRVSFELPNRRPIRLVAVEGFELPPVLASVVGNLPAVTVDEDIESMAHVVRIGSAGSDADIQIHEGVRSDGWTSVRSSDHQLVDGLALEDAVVRLPAGTAKFGSEDLPLLLANDVPLVSLSPTGQQVNVSEVVFDEESNVVRRVGYFVFWSRLFHHLAGWDDESLVYSPEQDQLSVEVGSPALVMKAGYTNFISTSEGGTAISATIGSIRPPVWQWLLAAALLVMLFEAVLNLRGKIT